MRLVMSASPFRDGLRMRFGSRRFFALDGLGDARVFEAGPPRSHSAIRGGQFISSLPG